MFMGRREALEKLIKQANDQELTVVKGASGIGKSSLLQAGLAAHFKRENISFAYIEPGRDPVSKLKNLQNLKVLIIDQCLVSNCQLTSSDNLGIIFSKI